MDDEQKKPAVGYKNPPKHSQFKKGQSGNSKGPTKGHKTFKARWQEAMAQQVTVVENGVSKKVDVIDAVILSLKNEAFAKRNLRATFRILDQSLQFADEDAANSNEGSLKPSEDNILKCYEQDILAQHGVYPALDNDARTSGVS